MLVHSLQQVHGLLLWKALHNAVRLTKLNAPLKQRKARLRYGSVCLVSSDCWRLKVCLMQPQPRRTPSCCFLALLPRIGANRSSVIIAKTLVNICIIGIEVVSRNPTNSINVRLPTSQQLRKWRKREGHGSWKTRSFKFTSKSYFYIQSTSNPDWWSIFGPIAHGTCLNLSLVCPHTSDCLVVYAGYTELLLNCMVWFSPRLNTLSELNWAYDVFSWNCEQSVTHTTTAYVIRDAHQALRSKEVSAFIKKSAKMLRKNRTDVVKAGRLSSL